MNYQDYLTTKYKIAQPPQADNAIDQSIQEVEATMARAVGRTGDTSWMFDPAWNKDMWELANKTMQDARTIFADEIADAADSDEFLYYPGTQDFYVYSNSIERFAYMMTFSWPVGCDIKMAPGECSGVEVFLPLQRGQFIVVFGICESCDAWARETAEINYRLSLLEAHARAAIRPRP